MILLGSGEYLLSDLAGLGFGRAWAVELACIAGLVLILTPVFPDGSPSTRCGAS